VEIPPVIKYEPSKILKKIAPEKKIKKLVSSRASLQKTALSFVDDLEIIDKKRVSEVALKVIKGYKERDIDKDELKDVLKDPRQLIQRVQSEIVLQISEEIRSKYEGEFYIWLPSDAEEPDPEHQLNYGQKFQIGDGEQPGDRPGCQCGMQILTEDTKLEL
jgi:hypothetical protein